MHNYATKGTNEIRDKEKTERIDEIEYNSRQFPNECKLYERVCIQRLRFHTNQLRKINKTKLVIQKADSNTILIYSDEFIMVLYDATRWLYDNDDGDDDGDDEIFVNKQPNNQTLKSNGFRFVCYWHKYWRMCTLIVYYSARFAASYSKCGNRSRLCVISSHRIWNISIAQCNQ